jgi:hypothetical protein
MDGGKISFPAAKAAGKAEDTAGSNGYGMFGRTR